METPLFCKVCHIEIAKDIDGVASLNNIICPKCNMLNTLIIIPECPSRKKCKLIWISDVTTLGNKISHQSWSCKKHGEFQVSVEK